METMKPRRCVTLGASSGSPHLAFCQASMRIDSDAECYLVSDESKAKDIAAAAERSYGSCHRMINTSPARAAKRMQSDIDIVALDLAAGDEDMDIVLERWLGLMSERSIILIPSINGGGALHFAHEMFASLQERYRSISFHHGDGLGVIVVGSEPSELMEMLLDRWKTASAARAMRDVFARLGRGIADQALNDQHKVKLGYANQRLEEVARERDLREERANELHQALDDREQEISKLNTENLYLEEKLADAQGTAKASSEELSGVRLMLAKAESALESSETQNQKLQNDIAERKSASLMQQQALDKAEAARLSQEAALASAQSELAVANRRSQEMSSQIQVLESQVSEKDINISTRFDELTVLTNMLEEADQKRELWERKAAQYRELNEEKKVQAKEFRRQLAKAAKKDEDRITLIKELRQKVEYLQARIVDLESSVNSSEAAYSDAMLRLDEARIKVDELEKATMAQGDTLLMEEGRSNQIAALQQSLNSNESALKEAVEREQVANKRLLELDKILQKTKKSLSARYDELGSLTAAMEATEAELKALQQGRAQPVDDVQVASLVNKKTSRRERKLERRKQQEALVEIETSEWFDAKWYLEQYPDIASEAQYGNSPALHYLKFGGFEGRDPSPHFDSAGYLKAYPDVALTGINPLLHYIRDGIKEERQPLPQ